MYVNDSDLVVSGLEGLSSFGALAAYAAVTKLQRLLNNFAEQAGFVPLSTRGQYGGCTQSALQKFGRWYAVQGGPVYAGDAAVDAGGPAAMGAVLGDVPPFEGLTPAEQAECQQAFGEWVAAGKPACGALTGGGGDEAKIDGEGDGSGIVAGDIPPPAAQRAGLGTAGWFLVGVAVVATAGGIWYAATRNRAPARLPARRY